MGEGRFWPLTQRVELMATDKVVFSGFYHLNRLRAKFVLRPSLWGCGTINTMKKLVSAIFILAFVLFVAPGQSYAAWWDFPSWFSKNQQQPQNATSSDMASGSQTVDQGVEKVEQKNALAPSNNTKFSDAKTIENLRAEVATLKTNLDNLEKRFSNLQKSTTPQPASGESDASQRIVALEKRVDALSSPDTSRLTKLEQKVAGLLNISTNTAPVQAKNYDSQISEMAKRINALLHANIPNSGPIYCIHLVDASSFKDGNPGPTCSSIFSDLNY